MKRAAPASPSGAGVGVTTVPPPPAVSSSPLPWSVSPIRIKHWTDTQLTAAIRRLINAEAYVCGADVSHIQVNAEEKARDEGCDAWTPAPPKRSRWLGSSATCWQLKAGEAGQPARIAAEVGKPIPRAMLNRGERFVVVASGSVGGKSARADRLRVLEQEARRLGIKAGIIDVLTSESLAAWLDEHPAVAGEFTGLPPGVELLSDWVRDPQHRDPWFPTPAQAAMVQSTSDALDPRAGTVTHVHIFGRPGVGKTRFALELCRRAGWRESVLYIRQPAGVGVLQTIAAVAAGAEKTLVLVVDEARSDQAARWAVAVGRAGGRLRLVTIGHEAAVEGGSGEIQIEPLTPETMVEAVQEWHPDMPREHVEFVAAFADGYVKLARLAARSVKERPSINVGELLQNRDVVRLMDNLLQGSADRRQALHVVAALNTVGWEGAREEEGKAIAQHLGLDWTVVRAQVHQFDRRLGIVPRRRCVHPRVDMAATANGARRGANPERSRGQHPRTAPGRSAGLRRVVQRDSGNALRAVGDGTGSEPPVRGSRSRASPLPCFREHGRVGQASARSPGAAR